MPLEKVRKVLKIAKEPLSLETPDRRRGGCRTSATSSRTRTPILPIDAAIQSNLRETTTRVLASLTPREERVLRMRFGIGMNTDHTLEEVGQQFSVTRERIRQIEAKALRKLKHPSRSQEAAELPRQLTPSCPGRSAARSDALQTRGQPAVLSTSCPRSSRAFVSVATPRRPGRSALRVVRTHMNRHSRDMTTNAAEGLPPAAVHRRRARGHDGGRYPDEGERIELIGGEIVPMSPKGNQHEMLKVALTVYWAPGCLVTCCSRPKPPSASPPTPTWSRISSFIRRRAEFPGSAPQTARLVVEIADFEPRLRPRPQGRALCVLRDCRALGGRRGAVGHARSSRAGCRRLWVGRCAGQGSAAGAAVRAHARGHARRTRTALSPLGRMPSAP